MIPERSVEQREGIPQRPPTELDLFGHYPIKLNAARENHARQMAFKRQAFSAYHSHDRLIKETGDRLSNLSNAQDEFINEAKSLHSSRATGIVYLRFLDELQPQGVSEEDIFSFFMNCMRANTRVRSSLDDLESSRGKQSLFAHINIMLTHGRDFVGEITQQILPNPPHWFNDGVDDWRKFAKLHGYFPGYLGIFNENSAGSVKVVSFTDDPAVFTFKGLLPDWFENAVDNNMLPEREDIESELAEDQATNLRTKQQLSQIVTQTQELGSIVDAKIKGVFGRISQTQDQVFSQIESLADLVTGLSVFREIPFYSIKPEDVAGLNMRNILNYAHGFGALESKVLNACYEADSMSLSLESFALWFEDKFKDAKLSPSLRDPLSEQTKDLIVDVLSSERNGEGGESGNLAELKITDKKAFRILNFDIGPLIRGLNQEQKAILIELLHEDDYFTDSEQFIWTLAELVHTSLIKEPDSPEERKKALSKTTDVRKHFRTWVRNHSQWAESTLVERLKTVEAAGQDGELVDYELAMEVAKTDYVVQDIKGGNLAGWRILYTMNRSSDPRHLVEIGGETLEERERELNHFIGANNISHSIPAASMIRALEWAVVLPPEVEQRRDKKEVQGEVFEKIRRQDTRIFYQADREKRALVIFVVKKQAYHYGF